MENEYRVLAIIPARSGSKRIPYKNIREFLGKPLISYTIEQSKLVSFIDRIIVDTDSKEISKIANMYGVAVPFLRPSYLATDSSKIIDSILYMLQKLEQEENYIPTHILILQTTSPLREMSDIEGSWNLLQSTDATTVVTVCETHPKLYHLSLKNDLTLVNGDESFSTNSQDWNSGYIMNGSVFLVKRNALLKEKRIITEKTKGYVCPKYRSIDIDVPEDWAIAEILYKQKQNLQECINDIEK